jgi:hypothetical protein
MPRTKKAQKADKFLVSLFVPSLNLDFAAISYVCCNYFKVVLLQDAIDERFHLVGIPRNNTELEVRFPVCIDKLVDDVWYVFVRDAVEIERGFHKY